MGQQRFEEAIAKLDFALTIDPHDAGVLRLRADYLQAALRLREAAETYRRVLALRPDVAAQANLALCERLLSQYGDTPLPDAAIELLWDAMLAQKREIEAMPFTARLGKSKETLLPMIRERLQTWSTLPGWNAGPDRVFIKDALVYLRLTGLPIADLEPLRGLPIEAVDLDHTRVTDLASLHGMRLRWLRLGNKRAFDLSPLAGMPLEFIDLTEVDADLSPLRGCPLKTVMMTNSKITDLSPLRDCPLETLGAVGSQIRSV